MYPSLETLVALARALGVRPALLLQQLGGDEEGRSGCLQARTRGRAPRHSARAPIIVGRPARPAKSFEPFL
jgi:hypothetical protein